MADSASAILLQRIQSIGSNVNLWGEYINTNLKMLEQASKGYQSLAVTTDATITWTNYTLANTGACARLKLTGSPATAVALTFPGYHNFLSVENTASQTVTIKCSGGTGVAIAAGARVLLYCDGVDYYNAAPTVFPTGITVTGQISGVVAGTAGTQAVNLTQMQAAIAVIATAQSGLVLNSLTSTVARYLEDAISVSGSLVKTKANAGTASETTNIAFTFDEGNQVLLGGVLNI